MQQKQRGQPLLAIQRVERAIHHVTKNKIQVQGVPTIQRRAQVGNKALAHLGDLLGLAALGVIALKERNFNGLHLRAVHRVTKQLRQAGERAVLCGIR